jgi:uncharacterized tellurite resistance protein B-like protein
MSRMVVGGGSSTNKDCDELLLLSYDLKASRKQGIFQKVDWKSRTYYHELLRILSRGNFTTMRNWKERLLKSLVVQPEQEESERFDRIQIATCVILLEVAKFDFDFSTIEKETTKAILKHEFDISEEAIEDLMKISEAKREDSVDIWEFTNVINQNFSREEKIKIIEAAWKIIYADDELDKYEDHYVHVLADLLRLRHDELIDAKLQVLYADRNNDDERGERDSEEEDDDDDETDDNDKE